MKIHGWLPTRDRDALRLPLQWIAALVLLAAVGVGAASPTVNGHITVILLGTGTPYPDAERFGPAVLVEAGDQKLLFDCGRGAVIRLKQGGVNATDIANVFLTHLHSDHVVGLPDLWLTGWFLGRRDALNVWGPTGTREMVEHLRQAYAFDLRIREGRRRNFRPGVRTSLPMRSRARRYMRGPGCECRHFLWIMGR